MTEKIRRYVRDKSLISPGDHVLAGVSGGADSVCLLLVLKELSAQMPFRLSAIHVDHEIRGEESRQDAAFVQRLCENLHVPCRICRADVPAEAAESGLGLEEAARKMRYAAFRETADRIGADRIAVAHHMEDDAETILFHLCRGTGIRGLAGIPPKRDRLIRPLLCVTREEIESFLQERGQKYRTDLTNQDIAYARNRIRINILPEMKKINSQVCRHMTETADEIREAADFLEREAEKLSEPGTVREAGSILIFRDSFLSMDPVLQRCRIHQLLGEAAGSRKDLTRRHIDQVTALFTMQTGRRIDLPYHMRAAAEYEGVRIFFPEEGSAGKTARNAGAFSVTIRLEEGKTQIWPGPEGSAFQTRIFHFDGNEKKIPKMRYTKWFDYDKLGNSLQIRFREPGDYLQISPRGGRKKLKAWMRDEKIPSEKRGTIPLVTEGDHVLWTVGYRTSEAFRLEASSDRVLEIVFFSSRTCETAGYVSESRRGIHVSGRQDIKERKMPDIKVLIPEKDINKRVCELGEKISSDFAGETVKLICILKGASFFTCELAKRITVPVFLDFMSCSSYGNSTESSGDVKIKKDLDDPVEGQNVIIVEDIIDSGRTLYHLKKILANRGAKSISVCTLLDKPERRLFDVKVDYLGFNIPDEFVVGFGLDYAQHYRNLPYIGVLEFTEQEEQSVEEE